MSGTIPVLPLYAFVCGQGKLYLTMLHLMQIIVVTRLLPPRNLSELPTLKYSRTPIIRTLVIRTANYPDRLGPSGKFVENSTKLTCLDITGYRIKYSAVLWLLELQTSRGRKV